jgi:hypothetical protein
MLDCGFCTGFGRHIDGKALKYLSIFFEEHLTIAVVPQTRLLFAG